MYTSYERPQVDVMEVEVELGFATSEGIDVPGFGPGENDFLD